MKAVCDKTLFAMGKNPACSRITWNASLLFNPIALRKAKLIYNFGLSECSSVNILIYPGAKGKTYHTH